MSVSRLLSRRFRSFCICWMLMVATGATAQEHLVIGREEWAPFQYEDDGKLTGIDIELVAAIMDRAGIRATFSDEMPWKRILKWVEEGRIDGAMSASKTGAREVFAHFSDPYRPEKMVLIVRRGEAEMYPFNDMKALAEHPNFRLGVVRGYYMGEAFETLQNQPAFAGRIQLVAEDDANIKKLLSKRLDGFLADLTYSMHMLKLFNAVDKVDVHPMPVNTSPVHLMFSKKTVDPATVERVNRAIAEIEADGVKWRIMRKYQE